jgi:hypothetical protein
MINRTVPTGAGWAYEIKHDGFRFNIRMALKTHDFFQRIRIYLQFYVHPCGTTSRVRNFGANC